MITEGNVIKSNFLEIAKGGKDVFRELLYF